MSDLLKWISFSGVQVLSILLIIQGIYLLVNRKKIKELQNIRLMGWYCLIAGILSTVVAIYFIFTLKIFA